MKLFQSQPVLVWSSNQDGLAVRFRDQRTSLLASEGRAPETAQLAHIRMQALAESGQAEVRDVEDGLFIASQDAVRLDVETRESFELPEHWPGGLRLRTESVPNLPGFVAALLLVSDRGEPIREWILRGPIVEAMGEYYLPTPAQFAALRAFCEWQSTVNPDEFDHLALLAALREAKEGGCLIDLEAYEATHIANAKEISVDAREDRPTGDLILRPVLGGNFDALSPDQIEERLGQLRGDSKRSVLRVGSTIVVLTPEQTAQARALVSRGRVPRAQVQQFTRNPQAWLADHVFPDIESEFSPRVTGIGEWKGGYLGAGWEEPEDWFGKPPAPPPKPRDEKAAGETSTEGGGQGGEPAPQRGVAPLVPLIIPNDTELGFGWTFGPDGVPNEEPFVPGFDRYPRPPMQHQREAILWLLATAQRALSRKGDQSGQGFGAGALLADDMGLGKTLSTLVFLGEWLDLWRKVTGAEPPAVLVVAPLSLLENWKVEIEKSFATSHQVFSRVLLAQGDAELASVRRSPTSRDVAEPGRIVEYGLGFGDGSARSVDMPGSCVLTTYQTLRDYRFSFAKAEWSAAVFDEAQNIKNPNALQTIAAKALKALLRITLTGTPVENHLGDFWSIIDASEPGPLGSFADFRREWILPMSRQPDRAPEIGSNLRKKVGGLMLRRLKTDILDGLPPKRLQPVVVPLSDEQIQLYDSVLESVRGGDDGSDPARQNRQLAALWHLRQVSLHPALLGGGSIPLQKAMAGAKAELLRSGKLTWLLDLLDQVRAAGEKVLIFCVQKRLQEALAHNLGLCYGQAIPIINGDTKTTSKRDPALTRLGLIEGFSNRPGFGVCVLSPIAAGAGLNVVAANHVVHLERHWNPAKEDQATDRAHRIGQTKPVKVYLPSATHPVMDSFDVVLDRLLQRKRALQSNLGLVPPAVVSAPEIMDSLFGGATEPSGKGQRPLELKEALGLSWRLFEALIAALYSRNSERVILTPGGSDHGCDVVVLGHGESKDNILIQCKSLSGDKLDSEVVVREVEGARPFVESALGCRFGKRCLHTTARKFSNRTLRAAALSGVELLGRSWLEAALRRDPVSLREVISWDSKRTRL